MFWALIVAGGSACAQASAAPVNDTARRPKIASSHRQRRCRARALFVVATAGNNLSIVLPVLARYTLHGGPQTAGALLSASRLRPSAALLLAAATGFGFALLAVAKQRTLPGVAVALFATGVCYTFCRSSSWPSAAARVGTVPARARRSRAWHGILRRPNRIRVNSPSGVEMLSSTVTLLVMLGDFTCC